MKVSPGVLGKAVEMRCKYVSGHDVSMGQLAYALEGGKLVVLMKSCPQNIRIGEIERVEQLPDGAVRLIGEPWESTRSQMALSETTEGEMDKFGPSVVRVAERLAEGRLNSDVPAEVVPTMDNGDLVFVIRQEGYPDEEIERICAGAFVVDDDGVAHMKGLTLSPGIINAGQQVGHDGGE